MSPLSTGTRGCASHNLLTIYSTPAQPYSKNTMNIVLLMLLIAQACLGICAWLSPRLLRGLAAHLLTRADVIDASRLESERRLRFWNSEFGLNQEHLREETEPALPSVPGFARR